MAKKANSNNEDLMLDLAINAGTALAGVITNIGMNALELTGQALDNSIKVQAIKEEVNEYVRLQKIIINLSTLAERISLECDTNMKIYLQNAAVAKMAIAGGYIVNEGEITRLLNTSVSDEKLIKLFEEEIYDIY